MPQLFREVIILCTVGDCSGFGVVCVPGFLFWLFVFFLHGCLDFWADGGKMGSGISWFLTQHCLYLSHMNIDLSREPQFSLQCPGSVRPQLVPPPLAAGRGKDQRSQVRSAMGTAKGSGRDGGIWLSILRCVLEISSK